MKSKPKVVVANKASDRVRRGGSFFFDALGCRSASRDWLSVGYAGGGFRLVKLIKKIK
jgi:formylglycine-generating enzyme required for sulfatase activity